MGWGQGHASTVNWRGHGAPLLEHLHGGAYVRDGNIHWVRTECEVMPMHEYIQRHNKGRAQCSTERQRARTLLGTSIIGPTELFPKGSKARHGVSTVPLRFAHQWVATNIRCRCVAGITYVITPLSPYHDQASDNKEQATRTSQPAFGSGFSCGSSLGPKLCCRVSACDKREATTHG